MNPDVDNMLEPIEQAEFESQDATNGSQRDDSDPGLSDDELREFLSSRETHIAVIGCGGGGCNTVNRIAKEDVEGVTLAALNTDVQHLVEIEADEKVLIGRGETNGRGAGSRPEVGEQAAKSNREAIKDIVDGSDMVVVTAGMGGGTGTGAAPVVAGMAKEAGALTVAVVTMPFTAEGELRRQNAHAGLERLRDVTDTLIIVMNDRLLDIAGDIPVQQAFKLADETLMRTIQGITELITTTGMVNVDFADAETVMASSGTAMVGFGESDSEAKARDAVTSAIQSPLLDANVDDGTAALVNVTGGPRMSIEEAEGVVEELYDRLDPDARIIWGTAIDESLDDTIRVMTVVTGVTASYTDDQH